MSPQQKGRAANELKQDHSLEVLRSITSGKVYPPGPKKRPARFSHLCSDGVTGTRLGRCAPRHAVRAERPLTYVAARLRTVHFGFVLLDPVTLEDLPSPNPTAQEKAEVRNQLADAAKAAKRDADAALGPGPPKSKRTRAPPPAGKKKAAAPDAKPDKPAKRAAEADAGSAKRVRRGPRAVSLPAGLDGPR